METVTAQNNTPFSIVASNLPDDAIGTIGWKIVDSDANIIHARSTAGFTMLSEGVYRLTTLAPGFAKTYYVILDDGDVDDPAEVTVELIVVTHPVVNTGYPTVEQIVGSSACAELTDASSDEQYAYWLAAIAGIEAYCGQSFEGAESGSITLDGNGSTAVSLPRHVESISAITVRGLDVSVSDVGLSDGGDTLLLLKDAGLGYYAQTMREISGVPRNPTFPADTGIITLTGMIGWTVCPPQIEHAIRADMEDSARADTNELSSTVAAMRKLGVRQINQGNLNLSLGEVGYLSPRALRYIPDALIWTSYAGYVA